MCDVNATYGEIHLAITNVRTNWNAMIRLSIKHDQSILKSCSVIIIIILHISLCAKNQEHLKKENHILLILNPISNEKYQEFLCLKRQRISKYLYVHSTICYQTLLIIKFVRFHTWIAFPSFCCYRWLSSNGF